MDSVVSTSAALAEARRAALDIDPESGREELCGRISVLETECRTSEDEPDPEVLQRLASRARAVWEEALCRAAPRRHLREVVLTMID